MGIQKVSCSLLAELKKDYPSLGGTVLQLGRQDVSVNAIKLLNVLNQFNIKPSVFLNPDNKSNIDDISLFKSLGFDSVESIDIDNYEEPTYTYDLNQPVPEFLHEKYDAIYDGGTTEHIFNFPESLKNIYKMLKVGGIIMHVSPSNNYVDHGFYSFSPTIFYDYYRANGFEIIKSYLFEVKSSTNKCLIYEYLPEEKSFFIPSDRFGRLLVWFVARKTYSSTYDVTPQQGFYVETWKKSKNVTLSQLNNSISPTNHSVQNGKTIFPIKLFIEKNKFLYSGLLPVARFIGLAKPLKPPTIATYDYQ
jgi:hypothetical protein